MTKQRIIYVTVDRCWAEKLRVVENIERFPAKLQLLRFADLKISLQHQIRIDRSRTGKFSPTCISRCTYGIVGKGRGVEKEQPVAFRIVIDAQRHARFVRHV